MMMKPRLICVSLFLCGAVIAHGATREVGSGQTYATISAALSAAVNGDVINVHAGTYNESFTIGKSVTIQANTGDSPIINCGSNNLKGITIAANNVTLDGLEVKNWGLPVGSTSGTITTGIYVYGLTGTTLKNLKVHGGNDPAGGPLSDDPIDVGNTGNNEASTCAWVRNSTKTLIRNCLFYRSVTGLKITSSHSPDNTFANGTIITNCEVRDCPNDGLDMQGDWGTVQDSYFHDCMSQSQTGPTGHHSDGLQFIEASSATGTDGIVNWHHWRVLRNRIRNVTQMIFLQYNAAYGDATDVVIADNLCWITPGAAIIHGCDPRVKAPGLKGIAGFTSDGLWIVNNTVIAMNTFGIECENGTHIFNNLLINNVGTGVSGSNAGTDLDYNGYFGNGINVKIGTTQYNLSGSSKPPGKEANCVLGDPQLASDPTSSTSITSAHLAVGSPMINKGTDVSLLLTQLNLINYTSNSIAAVDCIGFLRPAGYDIGAYEYQTSGGDTTPPTVSLTAPAAGATVSGSVTVSADATDDVGVVGVKFKVDGTLIGAEDVTAPYSVSWDTLGIANGTHSLTAVARDAAGHSTVSAARSVTVNNVVVVSTITPPHGVYALLTGGNKPSAAALGNADVSGISVRMRWDKLAPTVDGSGNPQYTWADAAGNAPLDAALQACVTANKPAVLRILTGGDKASTSVTGGQKPDWLYTKITTAGGKFISVSDFDPTGGATVYKSIPVYWDPTLTAEKKRLIDDLAARYATSSSYQLSDGTQVVKHIEISATNDKTEDWGIADSTVVDGQTPPGSTEKSRWLAAGFTDQNIISSHIDLLDEAIAVFTKQTVGIPFNRSGWNIDNPTNSTDQDHLPKAIIAQARTLYGGRFIPQKNNVASNMGTSFAPNYSYQILLQNHPAGAQDVINLTPPSGNPLRYNGNQTPADSNLHVLFGKATDSMFALGLIFSETYEADCNFNWAGTSGNGDPTGAGDTVTPGRNEVKYRNDKLNANYAAQFSPTPSPSPSAPPVTVTPNGGTFSSPVSVTLSTTDSLAAIHYTLNATPPLISSTTYSAPFTVTPPTTVKAEAFRTGYIPGPIATANFTAIVSSSPSPPANIVISP